MDDSELRALFAAQQKQLDALAGAKAELAAPELYELFELYKTSQLKRAGWRSLESMVRPFVDALADRPAGALAVVDWTGWRDSRAELAASTRNYILRMLKAFFRWAVAEGRLSTEPPMCRARAQPAKKGRETAPTEDDNSELLKACQTQRERVIVLCAVDSGMRRNEIRQLQWDWIRGRDIAIPNWAAKKGRGRVVPATRRQLEAIHAMPRMLRSPYVLGDPETGLPYHPQTFTWWWSELRRRTSVLAAPGEGSVRLHDGRHGYATNAVGRGVRLETVSEILGHASIQQTMTYVQRRPRDLDQAREAFEAGIAKDRRR